MPPEMVAFHGVPSYRIAGILPAVFIFSSCCTSPDATRDGGVPWRSLLSDRWHPAGSLYLFFLLHVSRCHQRWWRSMAFPLIGSLASCRQSLSFLPAVRRPMPPEMVAFHGVPSYRIAGILPAVFIFSSCCTSPDATRDGGVPWRSLLSDRWHPAGSFSKGTPDSSLALMVN
jgi:hypothetical protein